MRILFIVVGLLVLGALFVISENNIYLLKTGGFDSFYGIYVSWLNQIFFNIKSITGEAVKKQWLPINTTK